MTSNDNILSSFISFIEKSAVLNITAPNQQDANPDPRINPVDMGASGLKTNDKGIEGGPQKATTIKPIKF
jgi:hypothetical protein